MKDGKLLLIDLGKLETLFTLFEEEGRSWIFSCLR